MIRAQWLRLRRTLLRRLRRISLRRPRPVHLALLAPWLLLAPALVPGRALFWGTPVLQFYPWRALGLDLLWQGIPPLWNPFLGMGAPLAANHQSAFFYPLTWLPMLLGAMGGRSALIWGHALLAALHLTLAAWGMERLTRALGFTELGQAVAALAYTLSGYLVGRLGFFSINAATAWVPWVLWGVEEVVRAPRRRAVAGLGLALGLQWLAGHAQTAWYTDLLAALWALFLLARRPRRTWPRRLGALALAVLGGLLLAAVQLVPTAEYLLRSQRATGVDAEVGLAYSFWPWHLLNFLAPEAFGNPAFGDYWGYANYWEDAVYVGLIPFFLALGAVVRSGSAVFSAAKPPKIPLEPAEGHGGGKPSPAGLALFWWAVVLVGMALALGKHSPLFMALWRHVPTFDWFRGPARWTLWVEIGLALLAGLGAAFWRRPGPRGRYGLRLAAAGAGMVVIVALLLGVWAPQAVRSPTLLRGAALFGVMLWAAVMLALKAPQGNSGAWSWAVGVAVLLDLLTAGWGLNPTIPLGWLTEAPPEVTKVSQMVGSARLFLSPQDEYRLKFRRYFRFDTFWPPQGWVDLPASLLPNLALWAGISSANNFDPLVPGRYAAWLEAWESQPPEVQARWLARMGVSVLQRVGPGPDYAVTWEKLPPPEPLARWVPWAFAVPDASTALEAMRHRAAQAGPDWEEAIVIEGVDDLPPWEPTGTHVPGPFPKGQVVVVSRSPLETRYRVVAPAAGWLFLAEAWYPGWRAWVDGAPVPLQRAEYLFRAVAVPAGTHEVRVAYRPWWWPGVAVVSALAALGLLGLGWGHQEEGQYNESDALV